MLIYLFLLKFEQLCWLKISLSASTENFNRELLFVSERSDTVFTERLQHSEEQSDPHVSVE